MKKCLMLIGIIFGIVGIGKTEELRAQYRVWKSSALDASSYKDVAFTTDSIIVHSVILSSPTINQGGNSYLAMYQSTGSMTISSYLATVDMSTRIFQSLDQNPVFTSQSQVYDLKFTSSSIYSKQGAARIQILWDWYNANGNVKQQGVHPND